MGRGARAADLALVVVAALVLTLALDVLDVPSPWLSGGLLAGLAGGLAGRRRLAVPRPVTAAAQGLVGVSIGALVDGATLEAIGRDWLPVLLVTLGTLLSVLAGLVLWRQPGGAPGTAPFTMIAGGASGVTGMARELGADATFVLAVRVLRLFAVLLSAPLLARWLRHTGG